MNKQQESHSKQGGEWKNTIIKILVLRTYLLSPLGKSGSVSFQRSFLLLLPLSTGRRYEPYHKVPRHEIGTKWREGKVPMYSTLGVSTGTEHIQVRMSTHPSNSNDEDDDDDDDATRGNAVPRLPFKRRTLLRFI